MIFCEYPEKHLFQPGSQILSCAQTFNETFYIRIRYMHAWKFFENSWNPMQYCHLKDVNIWTISEGKKLALELSLIKNSDGMSLSRFSLSHQFIYSQSPFQWGKCHWTNWKQLFLGVLCNSFWFWFIWNLLRHL